MSFILALLLSVQSLTGPAALAEPPAPKSEPCIRLLATLQEDALKFNRARQPDTGLTQPELENALKALITEEGEASAFAQRLRGPQKTDWHNTWSLNTWAAEKNPAFSHNVKSWREGIEAKVGPIEELSAKDLKFGFGSVSETNLYVFEATERSTGSTVYWRPARTRFMLVRQNHGYLPRNEMAASVLNQAMDLEVAPKARLVRYKGELGTLSEQVSGKPIYSNQAHHELNTLKFNAPEAALKDAQAKHAQWLATQSPELQRKYYDAHAFEFLIGNVDAHAMNFYVDEVRKTVKVFDHDLAFYPGALAEPAKSSMQSLGRGLPAHYTQEFATKLKLMDEAKIQKALSPYLDETAIQGVLDRRRIILKDIELRGNKAILPPLK